MEILNSLSILLVILILGYIIYVLVMLNRHLKEKLIYERNKYLLYQKEVNKLKDIKDPDTKGNICKKGNKSSYHLQSS